MGTTTPWRGWVPGPGAEAPARARRGGVAAGAVLAVAVTVALIGLLLPELVWVRRLAGYPVLWLLGGTVGSCAVLATSLASPTRRMLAGMGATLGGIAMAGGLLTVWLGSPVGPTDVVPRPDGRAEAVLTPRPTFFDPYWEVTVRQRDGLPAREWLAACLDGDDPADSPDTVTWSDPTTLALRLGDGRTLTVRTDPVTGRPLEVVSAGAYVCG